jgi:hypothetical protein
MNHEPSLEPTTTDELKELLGAALSPELEVVGCGDCCGGGRSVIAFPLRPTPRLGESAGWMGSGWINGRGGWEMLAVG